MTILETIARYKHQEIAAAKSAKPGRLVAQEAAAAPPVRPFLGALRHAEAIGRYGLIAEIKKASPSKGLIRADFDPPALARAYERGGAACLSVLTDGPSFQGAGAFLTQARAATKLPVLRKDFLFDAYQVTEARALGADCILIILAAVSDAEAAALEAEALRWSMDVLVEVHDEQEMARAHLLRSRMIGINNRNLHTFETALDVTERLKPNAPAGALVIAESGMSAPGDLLRLARAGVRSFLIGESLMRADDVEGATRAILERPHA